MPIVKFSHNYSDVPADAVNIKFQSPGFNLNNTDPNAIKIPFGPYAVFTWDTYTGLCVSEREHNTYHDSDFYMTVWDEVSQSPKTIQYATTRGWTYPALASRVDATSEILEKYRMWCEARNRKISIQDRLDARAKRIKIARAIGEPNYTKLKKLYDAVNDPDRRKSMELLFTTKLRSDFKKSMRQQILDWYFAAESIYPRPLSAKQWKYI